MLRSQLELTDADRNRVRDVAAGHDLPTDDPDQLVSDALEVCVTSGATGEDIDEVLRAARIHLICGRAVWYQERNGYMAKKSKLDVKTARAILKQAKKDETYEGSIPKDDDKAVKEAQDLVTMAEEAWESNVRGKEVKAILDLAKNGSGSVDDDGDDDDDGDEGDDEARIYTEDELEELDKEDLKEILEERGLELEGRYSQKKAIAAILDDQPEAEEEEGEEESEDDEENLAETEPWEDYDEESATDIKEGIKAAVEDEEDDLDDLLAHIYEYESANKERKGILSLLEEIAEERKGDDDEEGEEEEEEPSSARSRKGRGKDSASSEDDDGDESGDEDGEGDGEEASSRRRKRSSDAEDDSEGKASSSRRKRSRASSEEDEEAGDDADGDDEYRGLIESIKEKIDAERLHVPEPIEDDPVELPFDITEISDSELQALHSAFGAYAYREGYLQSIEESKAKICKQAADEITRELLVESASNTKDPKVTLLEAEAELDDNVKKWRKRQRKHEAFAKSHKNMHDNHLAVVEMLSRQETMRQQAWERSGGGGSEKASRKRTRK